MAIALISLAILIALVVITPLVYLTTGWLRAFVPGRRLATAALVSFGAWVALDQVLDMLSVNGAQFDVISPAVGGLGGSRWDELAVCAAAHLISLSIHHRHAVRAAA